MFQFKYLVNLSACVFSIFTIPFFLLNLDTIFSQPNELIDNAKTERKSEPDNICSPRNGVPTNKILTPFLVQRWLDARSELRMQLPNSNPGEYSKFRKLLDTTVMKFNSFSHGASESIRKNFHKAISENRAIITSRTATMRFNNMTHFKLLPQRFINTFRSPLDLSKVTVFTFVRDPMTHFESGLAEATDRTATYHRRSNNVSNWKLNSTDELKAYLKGILDFDISDDSPLKMVSHIFPMAGVLLSIKIDIYGHLETFKMDWEKKIMPQYNLSKPFSSTVGMHKTSINHPTLRLNTSLSSTNNVTDPFNLRHYYHRLLTEEPTYAKAICNLVLIDYVCLPHYELPPECKSLQHIRLEGMKLLAS